MGEDGRTGSRASLAHGVHRKLRATKTWIGTDARDLSVDQDSEKQQIVKGVTRFATAMCVVIAIVKVGVYFKTKQEVVRTSALDSLGDLVANMMTLYTGYRMTQIDQKRYPCGQAKFQSIGCLVFATFMFALMFGNALGNVESLIESKDEVGVMAISRFFTQTESLGGQFKDWHAEVSYDEEEEMFTWTTEENGAEKMPTPMIQYWEKRAEDKDNDKSASEKAMGEALAKEMTKGEIVMETSKYENEQDQKAELIFQNSFLAVCATYKCCLWLFCILYAIPKSGSAVLVALATDKRNDFIGTFSVIIATSLAFVFRRGLEDNIGLPEEKVDPLVSLVLSSFIMYSWQGLMVEHMTLLSQESAADCLVSDVQDVVKQAVQATGCKASDVVIYNSSEKNTIEVTLEGESDSSFGSVKSTADKLKRNLESVEDVERVIIKYHAMR